MRGVALEHVVEHDLAINRHVDRLVEIDHLVAKPYCKATDMRRSRC